MLRLNWCHLCFQLFQDLRFKQVLSDSLFQICCELGTVNYCVNLCNNRHKEKLEMSGSIAQYISSTRDSFAENSSVEFLLNSKSLGKSKKKWIFIGVAGVVTLLLIIVILCSLLPYSSEEALILLNNNTETLELESMEISSNSTYGEFKYSSIMRMVKITFFDYLITCNFWMLSFLFHRNFTMWWGCCIEPSI